MGSGVATRDVRIDAQQAGMRLDRALADLLPDLSRERLKALILESHVRAGARAVTDPAARVAADDAFAVDIPDPVPARAAPQDIPLVVVHEDADLIVIDKPAGLVVHPAAGNLDGTLVNALLHHCAGQLSGIGGVARPGIVHRIDKDTSGLIVAAKTDAAHEGLARQFKAHSIDRRYIAFAAGVLAPPAGTVTAAIGRSSADRKKMAVVRDGGIEGGRGKHATTHYRTLAAMRGATMVECRLETGRTHQVRVHMAHIGHPLLGDPLYGRAAKGVTGVLDRLGFGRQALHAARLGFTHPVTGHALSFDSPVPADMQELFRELGV